MNKRAVIGIAFILAGLGALAAVRTEIGRMKRRFVVKDGVELVAACPKIEAFPGEIVPAFRFDASSRAGWEISGGRVTKIPSLADSGRYLTTNENEFVQWKGWKNGRIPLGAELNLNEGKEGIVGPYLDFGDSGSFSGLLFNPDRTTGSNGVYNILTVIAVFESSRGGGFLLGGGWGVPNRVQYPTAMLDGNAFTRTVSSYSNPFGSDSCPASIFTQFGVLFHDALWFSAPMLTGFSGGWEVISWRPYDAAYPANASGVGVGSMATGNTGTASGGQSIAEMIIYTNRLTDAQCEKVSAYLRRKWFGESVPGYDGLAEAGVLRLSHSGENGGVKNNRGLGAVYPAVSVGADERFVVDRVSGGYHGGTFTKKGAGTFAVRAAETYSGTFDVTEGTLSFTQCPIPAALPARGRVLHLDADAAATRTERAAGDVTYLVKWADCDGGVYGAEALSEACQPVLRYGDFANGRPCVDFGPVGSGRLFDIVKANSVTSEVERIMSIVYVIGAQEGGGTLFSSVNKSFAGDYCYQLDRGSWTNSFLDRIWHFSNDQKVNQVCYDRGGSFAGAYYFNGEKDGYRDEADSDRYFGFQTPGWQTVGANVLGGKILTLGGSRWKKRPCTGGMRLAELAVYDRPLTEQETRDASAYLAWKWFGKVNAGYSAPSGGAVAAAQNVVVGTAATLDVDGGAVRLDRLATNAVGSVLTKTGAGVLEIVSADAAVLNVAAGTVRAVPAPEPPAADAAADGASLWLDAADADALTAEPDDAGAVRVKVWGDTSDPRRAAYAASAETMPFLDADETQNGLPMIDFGPYGADGATMNFARPLDGILSVFMVVRFDPDGAAPLLGFSMDDRLFGSWPPRASADFVRRRESTDTDRQILCPTLRAYSGVAQWGTFFTNGVETTSAFVPSADCQLVEVHLTRGAYASALCYEASNASAADANKMRGGLRVGELIAYERRLTDREKAATRNYLMKKWFGKGGDALTPLPDVAAPTMAFASVNVSPGASFETAAGTALAGNLAYADGATLTIGVSTNLAGEVSSGVVRVGGTVSFGKPLRVAIEPALPRDVFKGVRVKVLSADMIDGAANLAEAELPASYAGMLGLRVYNDGVYLVDATRGLTLIVR